MNSQILSKKWTALVVVTAGLLAVNSFAADQTTSGRSSSARHSSCTNATLTGRFAVINALGFVPSGPPPASLVPNAFVGVMTLDGAGNVSFEVTISVSGQISRQVQLGTYTLKADCTGQLTTQPTDLPFPISNDVVVASLDDGGKAKSSTPLAPHPEAYKCLRLNEFSRKQSDLGASR